MGEFFQQSNNIFTPQMQKQPDNKCDQYAAKSKHHLGSEQTLNTQHSFFSQASIGPE